MEAERKIPRRIYKYRGFNHTSAVMLALVVSRHVFARRRAGSIDDRCMHPLWKVGVAASPPFK